MKHLLIAFLSFLACYSFAQESLLENPQIKINSIKVSLLDMLEPASHTFLLSYEFQIGQHFSLLSEGGFIIGQYQNKKANGHKIREELRCFLTKEERMRSYVGLQFMHKNFRAEDLNNEFYNKLTKNYDYLNFDYSKKVNALHLSLGFIKIGYGRQIIDLGCFIGGRKLVTKATGLSDEWSLRSDDASALDTLLNRDEIPQSKTTWIFGAYFRYGFRVGPI